MKTLPALLLCAALLPATALAAEGLVSVPSTHDVATTAERLVSALKEKGMTVFERIDHAAAAREAGLTLAPTEVVVFGNPKVGTVLMHCGHTAAIDLPLKALIWEDAEGDVLLTYNSTDYLAERHGLTGCPEALGKVKRALADFARAATQ